MRISTAQMFNQTSSSVLKHQSNTSEILGQISSGKKVITAGDNPVAAIAIDNIKQQNTQAEQYLSNIDIATGRLSVTESTLGSVENLLQSMRDKMLQGVNGSLSDLDRQALTDELQGNLDQLVDLANSKDSADNSIFSGFKTDVTPFAFDSHGDISYSGDSGVRDTLIASNSTLATNIAGDSLFMSVPNAMGDYSASYDLAQQGDFSVKSAKVSDSTTHASGQYQYDFIDNGAGGLDVDVTDPSGTVTRLSNLDATQPIILNGLTVQLEGTPVAGDTVTLNPESNANIFDSLSDMITLLETGEVINTPQGQAEFNQLLNNIDSGQAQLALGRSQVGNDLNALDKAKDVHIEMQLVNTSALSLLEDLDIASAITEYEKQQLSLNVVSQLFAKVNSVSLFDYL
ncbi:flagellar hook-associated protein FlgL [Shewanella surugensis]|uniref:Flagellar hook-associated protein FlgL n=1 Tax=Shewanella surugensis TaxID=212020 RepID=A0ABT0LDQ1_9GAMM|nr:flagellar hook-associated protein FlgL [Shewanella surugensis]MCL1125455.1 flagellar hook-associated protein FlgL [Shewanella surugensis]